MISYAFIHPLIIICSTFIHPLIMISIKIHPCVGSPAAPPPRPPLSALGSYANRPKYSCFAQSDIYMFSCGAVQIAHDLTANGFRRFVIICVHQTDKGVVVVVVVVLICSSIPSAKFLWFFYQANDHSPFSIG
jgi:hypothetical protein